MREKSGPFPPLDEDVQEKIEEVEAEGFKVINPVTDRSDIQEGMSTKNVGKMGVLLSYCEIGDEITAYVVERKDNDDVDKVYTYSLIIENTSMGEMVCKEKESGKNWYLEYPSKAGGMVSCLMSHSDIGVKEVNKIKVKSLSS